MIFMYYILYRHLSLLCTFVLKSIPMLRLPSIEIMRNMSFSSNNKAALIVSGNV